MKRLAILLSCLLALAGRAQDLGLAEKLQREALAYAETQAAGLPGSYSIRVLRPPALPRLPPGQVRLEPTHASKQDFLGPFFVAFRVFVNEAPAGSARVDLEGKWVGTLLRARTAPSPQRRPHRRAAGDRSFRRGTPCRCADGMARRVPAEGASRRGPSPLPCRPQAHPHHQHRRSGEAPAHLRLLGGVGGHRGPDLRLRGRTDQAGIAHLSPMHPSRGLRPGRGPHPLGRSPRLNRPGP